MLTTLTETWTLQESQDEQCVYPSMSQDGTVIASGRVKTQFPRTVVVQTYSMTEKKWTVYRDIANGGAIIISPDGSQLAFATYDDKPGTPVRIHFINLKTRTESVSPVIGRYNGRMLSWSPDGRRIVYEMNESPLFEKPTIHILDIETEKLTKIADGAAPAWSPSGEWIAYFNNSKGWVTGTERKGNTQWYIPPETDQVSMIRPDGTSFKTLVTLPRGKMFMGVPVWSPDSTKILLNELWNEPKFTMSIHLLDLTTGKLTRKFKDTPIVYAWAEAK